MNRLARPEMAIPVLEAVFSNDSYFPPSWEFPQGHSQVLLGDHERAIAHFRSVLDRLERFIPARVQLPRALRETADGEGSKRAVARVRAFSPKYGLAHAARMFPYPVEAERRRLLDALSGTGMN